MLDIKIFVSFSSPPDFTFRMVLVQAYMKQSRKAGNDGWRLVLDKQRCNQIAYLQPIRYRVKTAFLHSVLVHLLSESEETNASWESSFVSKVFITSFSLCRIQFSLIIFKCITAYQRMKTITLDNSDMESSRPLWTCLLYTSRCV